MKLFIVISFLLFVFISNVYTDASDNQYRSVKNSHNFSGKVVLVTGSTSGIGESIVKLFSTLGAKVVVTGRRKQEIRRVAKEAQELSPNNYTVYL